MTQHEDGLLRWVVSGPRKAVVFPLTDESLEAIMAGLEPKSDDSVLSVAGCGDQAFAILEKAGKVIVCDINEAQLDFIRKRKAALESKDYKTFFYGNGSDHEFYGCLYRLDYFREEGRIARIQKKLPNLEIVSSKGIENFVGDRTFTKVYASNAIGELYKKHDLDVYLTRVAGAIQEGGLLYVSNGAEINNLVPDISKSGLQLVPELTKRVRSAEKLWTPNVYRKVSLEK